jgi:hypothetical protein
LPKRVQRQGTVRASAIDDDDVSDTGDLERLHFGKQALNTLTFIDDRNNNAPRALSAKP